MNNEVLNTKFSKFIFISCYLVERRDDALPCAVTNLLLNPVNTHMIDNMKYYTELGQSVDEVQPREVCSVLHMKCWVKAGY